MQKEIVVKVASNKISKLVYTQARKWMNTLRMMLTGHTAGAGRCQGCGKEASVRQEKVELCTQCNYKVYSWEYGRKIEGFILLSWIIAEVGRRTMDASGFIK